MSESANRSQCRPEPRESDERIDTIIDAHIHLVEQIRELVEAQARTDEQLRLLINHFADRKPGRPATKKAARKSKKGTK